MVDSANNSEPNHFRYRSDVDGLRAVAVLMVLLFHAGFGFSGGYVGVDVFFVISGFLITGLILQQQDHGTFSMAEFWKRRIRRILPAATLVVLVTLVAGYFLLLPHDLKDLAESTIYQQLMAANFYFWHHTGYFDGPADLKPLLHTWSLAVEEQFYLGYPIVLVLLRRLSRVQLFVFLGFSALLSFALSAILVSEHPGATFYALPTRAWELLLGGMLAAWPAAIISRRWIAEVVSLAGLAMMLFAGLAYDSATEFPGPNALMPCLGTVLIIAGGTSHKTLVQRLLSCRPFVFIGLISYSLYLWHRPLLVYQRYWFGDHVHASYRATILLGSFALAVLSWKYVESPFRSGKQKTQASGRTITFATMASALLMLGLGSWIMRSEGCPERMPAEVLAIIEDTTGSAARKAMNSDVAACNSDHLPLIGDVRADDQISFVLWGDSHALAVAKLCDELAQDYGIKGALATKSGTAAFLGDLQRKGEHESIEWNEAVFNYIHRNRITNVLIVSRWLGCVQSGNKNAADHLAKALDHTTQLLSENGIQVWIMMQVPEQPENPQRGLALAAWSGRSTPYGVTIERHSEVQKPVFQAFAKLDSSIVLNPDVFCFDAEGRSRIGSGKRSYYRDDDHLSYVGAKELIRPLLRPVFAKIAEQKTVGMPSAIVARNQDTSDALSLTKAATW